MTVRSAAKAKSVPPQAPARSIRLANDRVSQRSCRARWTTSRRRPTATGRPCRGSTSCSTSSRRVGTTSRRSILGSLLDHRTTRSGPTTGRARCCSRSACRSRMRSASPLGRSGGFSDGRDIGVVCNLPNTDGASCCRCRATSARSTRPRRAGRRLSPTIATCSATTRYRGAIAVVLGGEASVATNGFWSALTMATTLQAADAVLHRGQRPRDLREGRHADAGRRTSRANLASFGESVHPRRRWLRPGRSGDAARARSSTTCAAGAGRR